MSKDSGPVVNLEDDVSVFKPVSKFQLEHVM
jgi:hypothetical protein